MKKYCFLLFFVLAAASAHGQFAEGDISVTRKELCKRGNDLYMQLDIRISSNSLTRSQSWTIVPELSTPDRQSVKIFPHVVIYGPYQRHMAERRRVLRGAYWIERPPYAEFDIDHKRDQGIDYQMSVPYESWMADASLVIRQIQTSPGNKRRIFTIDVNGAVDTSLGNIDVRNE